MFLGRILCFIQPSDIKRSISFSRYASIKYLYDSNKFFQRKIFFRQISCDENILKKRRYDLLLVFGGMGKKTSEHYSKAINANLSCEIKSEIRSFGEDASFVLISPRYTFFGIADGVGGYNKSGIDPSIFSSNLMNFCLNEAREYINFQSQPESLDIMDIGYKRLIENIEPIYGGSTALITNFDHESGLINISNLGDSKIVIVETLKGSILSSISQQHYFNCPFQLGNVPAEDGRHKSDLPNMSEVFTHQLTHNDIIILGSDGFFDNMFETDILSTFEECMKKSLNLQQCFQELLGKARKYSLDPERSSPFSTEYSRVYKDQIQGGKEDDITLIIAVVIDKNM